MLYSVLLVAPQADGTKLLDHFVVDEVYNTVLLHGSRPSVAAAELLRELSYKQPRRVIGERCDLVDSLEAMRCVTSTAEVSAEVSAEDCDALDDDMLDELVKSGAFDEGEILDRQFELQYWATRATLEVRRSPY